MINKSYISTKSTPSNPISFCDFQPDTALRIAEQDENLKKLKHRVKNNPDLVEAKDKVERLEGEIEELKEEIEKGNEDGGAKEEEFKVNIFKQ